MRDPRPYCIGLVHVQRAQKYFLDAELTSMVCDSDELSDEDEDTRDKSLKVGAFRDFSLGVLSCLSSVLLAVA